VVNPIPCLPPIIINNNNNVNINNINPNEKVILSITPTRGRQDTRVYFGGINLQAGDAVLFGNYYRYLTPHEHDNTRLFVSAPLYKAPTKVSVKLKGSRDTSISFEYHNDKDKELNSILSSMKDTELSYLRRVIEKQLLTVTPALEFPYSSA